MDIILVRHGQPTVSLQTWIQGSAVLRFIEQYDAAGIVPTSVPAQKTRSLVQRSPVVVTSHLPRTLQSAQILHPDGELMSDALFRETHCWSNFEVKLSLPALSWIAASRGLWSFGYPVGEETPQQVKHRAEQAAQYLIDIATQEDCVVLVGHGGFNYHIGKVLHTLGWQSSRSRTFGLAHWGCIHFTLLHHIS